jgi:hypothetical protein
MEASENKKGFLQNDRLLVCSMLVFYGVCIIGLIGATFWWLNQRNQTISANATATGIAAATRRADATATAVARTTELAQYEFIDTFDTNINRWRMGPENSDYWIGSTQVTSGFYIWNVREVKKSFVSWADFPGNDYIKNYDTYVDTKFAETPGTNACSGLIFRKAPLGWDNGGYSFMVCKSGYFKINYHNIDGWQTINSQYHPAIQTSDWNRIEVLVKDAHFVFLINSQIVYETNDDRQSTGGVALIIDVDEAETQILFDNFGYQSR